MDPRLLVLTLTSLAFGSTAFIFTGVLDQVAHDLGVSVAVAGQLQTAYVLTSALTGPPLALLIGRRDRKRIILLGVGLLAALNAVCMFGGGFTELIWLRALMGAAGGVIAPAAATAAAALAPPERRGTALATVTGGVMLAFMVGIPLGSVVGDAFGWRASFALAAGLSGAAFLGVTLFLPPVVPGPAPRRTGAPWRPIAPLLTISFVAFSANMAVNAYIAPILRIGAEVTGAGVGAFQMLIGVGGFIGLSLGGRGGDAGAPRALMAGAFGIQALAMSLYLNELTGGLPAGWPTYGAVAAAILLLATALFGLAPMIQTRVLTVAGDSAPVALALNSSAVALGQASGAAVGGVVLAHAGVVGLPVFGAGMALLGAVLCKVALPPGRAPA